MTRRERLTAMASGRQAGEDGRPVADCPYRMDTAKGRALAQVWVRAWLRARREHRPPPVSYDG